MEKFSGTKSVSFPILHIVRIFFLKIGSIIKKWGAKGVHRGSKFDFFQCLFSLFIHLFISYIAIFQILLVCEEF